MPTPTNQKWQVTNTNDTAKVTPETKQYLSHKNLGEVPAMITGLAGILGNLPGMLGNYDIQESRKEGINPELINLEREREIARKQAESTKNIMMNNLRQTPTANYLSNMGAAAAGIDSGLGDIVGRSYLNEETTNADIMNRAKMFNAQQADNNARLNYEIAANNMANRNNAIQGMVASGQNATNTWMRGASDARTLNTAITEDYMMVPSKDGKGYVKYFFEPNEKMELQENPGYISQLFKKATSKVNKKK
jgi:hypothetical protein